MTTRNHVVVGSLRHHNSKMCRFYVEGSCSKGDSCNFAHGREQLCEARALFAAIGHGASKSCGVTQDVPRVTLELDKTMGMTQMPMKDRANEYSVDSSNVVTKATTRAMILRPGLLQNTQIPCLTISALAEHKDATTTRSDASEDSTHFDSISQVSSSDWSPGLPRTWTSSRQTTANTDDAHSLSVVVPQGVVGTQCSSARALRNKFHKTKICEFFERGKCRKRGACNFAHSAAELGVQPDLSFTKLCPSMLGNGKCKGVECTFAHDVSELRMGQAKQELRAEASGPTADVAKHSLAEGSPYQLCVKNTFLTVEDPRETEVLKRTSSAPGRFVPLGGFLDDEDKVLWRQKHGGSRIVSEAKPQQVLANVETQKKNRIRNSVAVVQLEKDPRPSSPPPKAPVARSEALGTTPRLG